MKQATNQYYINVVLASRDGPHSIAHKLSYTTMSDEPLELSAQSVF